MEAAVLGLGVTVSQSLISRAVYNLYDTLGNSVHPVVKNVLEELDIAAHLEVVEVMVKEIPENTTESVKICMKNIEKVLNNIQQLLVDINNETAYHNTKWFAHWRTCNLEDKLEALKKYKAILDQRIDLLTKVLAVSATRQPFVGKAIQMNPLDFPSKPESTVEFTLM